MLKYHDFEEIRPYNSSEFAAAWERIRSNEHFHAALSFLFNTEDKSKLEGDFCNIKSTQDFQLKIMHRAIRNILAKSSNGLSHQGFEFLHPNQPCTFIANHRDIFLDSGILQILLVENGFDTSEITFGSNLMLNQFLVDIGKVNKMFTVHRSGNRRELYENSMRLSNYMRHAILDKKQSTWIAQRNGRTKNGCDETQVALLKMLFASKSENFVQSFQELNLVPVCISYELEPCDAFKVQEIYNSQQSAYVKEPGEDLRSIIAGVVEPKGKIHLEIRKPVQEVLHTIAQSEDPFKALCVYLDQEIHAAYQLFPSNYLAFDLLHCSDNFSQHYTDHDKAFFVDYMERKLDYLKGNAGELKKIFLSIYANPVINARKQASSAIKRTVS